MNREELSKALSLSCVENYYLVWLGRYIDIRKLYFNSFISAAEVLNDFLTNDADYANYAKIKRIQDIAEEMGVSRHVMYNSLMLNKDKDNLILIRVNKSFFNSSKLVPWRADHYICILQYKSKNLKYINNYPLSIGILTEEKLKEYFDNNVLVYTFNKNINLEKCEDQAFNILFDNNVHIVLPDNYNIKKLRDAIGILKVTRKRLWEWLKYMAEKKRFVIDFLISEYFMKHISKLEKLYLRLEFSIIRNKQDIKYFNAEINEIGAAEKKLSAIVNKRRIANE